jgi:branched-chain amino acid transport system substrate-binding protein
MRRENHEGRAKMKVSHPAPLGGKARALLAVLLIACLAVIPLVVACGGDEEETPTPAGTPAATPTTPATPAATGTPGEVGPGITDTEIIIGADAIISGAFGAFYAMIPQAVDAYFDYVNDAQGGVCGRQIVYKVEDNQDDPAKGLEAARKLVEQDKVFAMIGSLGDSPHPAVWEYLNDQGVPDILISAGSHMFGADPEGHPWTVQMIPSYRIEGTFFGQYISENLPGKKVGILYPNLVMGTDLLEGVKDGLDPDKNEVVSEESYEITAVSIASQVTNMRNAGTEVLVTNASPPFTAQAVQQAERLGWEPDLLMSYINSDETMFLFIEPELLDGAISFQALKLAVWTDDPAVAEHHRIMGEYGGPNPTNFSIYAQTLAEVAVEALSRTCDNLTREGLMDALESIEDYHSDLFIEEVSVSFSDTDHTGLQTGKMLRASVEDGKGKFEYFGPLFEFE